MKGGSVNRLLVSNLSADVLLLPIPRQSEESEPSVPWIGGSFFASRLRCWKAPGINAFPIRSYSRMPPMKLAQQIAYALEAAPPSMLLGMVTRDPRLRERSRDRLAELIVSQIEPSAAPDGRQLGLPL